ncbi:MAG TPA: hypothetical protein VKU37_02160 [Verrucomicrobiae bacterium]|nr:hypothetical protein [Verrucomicrobiae bacterium]
METLKQLKEEMQQSSFRTSIQTRRDCLSKIVPLLNFAEVYYENAMPIADILGRPDFSDKMYEQAFARMDFLVGQAISDLEHNLTPQELPGSQKMNSNASINPQETTTAELVEIVREEAESWQQPDEVIWSELMARFCWIGCPKEDLVLIGGLDSLLRPLNKGYTKLPPRTIYPAGAAIPPPPPYYQKKVSLSEVLNQSPVQTVKTPTAKDFETIPSPKPPSEISNTNLQKTDKILPPNRNSFSLEKLRGELTSSQQRYLDLFWEHYLDCGQWPKTVDFHRDHDINDVQESLRASPLNGSIVMEQNGGGDEHYELKLVGVLLTKNGKRYEEMRIHLLEFLSKKYYHTRKEERRNRYSDEEIAVEIKLSEEDMKMLGKVGEFDCIYRTYGSSSVNGHWSIEFPRKEIQSIPRKGPFADYHEKIVSQQYYPEWKVFVEDRNAAQRGGIPVKGNIFEHLSTPILSDSPSPSEQNDASPLTPVPDVSFVKDEKLRNFAAAAAQEASRCFGAKAFTATAVMAGSAIEAVLLDLLLQHTQRLTVSKDNPIEKWQLGELIKKASKMNLLGAATSSLTQFVQQHRNLIHPGKSLREKRILDKSDAYIIWGVFMKICIELNSPSAADATSLENRNS